MLTKFKQRQNMLVTMLKRRDKQSFTVETVIIPLEIAYEDVFQNI